MEDGPGKELWESLRRTPEENILERFSLPALRLFLDATRAFDAEAYYGTSVLCRATLEAILYTMYTRSDIAGGEAIHYPRKEDGSRRYVSYADLVEFLKELNTDEAALPAFLVGRVEGIIDRGDVAAHLAAYEDQDFVEPDTWQKLRQEGKDPALDDPVRINPETVLRDLRDTTEILRRLARFVAACPERLGGLEPSDQVGVRLDLLQRDYEEEW